MAEVAAPVQSWEEAHGQPHGQPHGKKRAADTSLESEQRLSKRFDLLNIVDNNGTRLYIPVAGSSDAAATSNQTPSTAPVKHLPANIPTHKKRNRMPRPPPPSDELMEVEDTPNRVYIRDLSAELSDIESDEENPVFLSDIEKHLAKIPKHILMGPDPKPTLDNQLVLYNVPTSLSVPAAQDSVRRAIVEARARVRDRQAIALAEPERVNAMPTYASAFAQPDADAMDID